MASAFVSGSGGPGSSSSCCWVLGQETLLSQCLSHVKQRHSLTKNGGLHSFKRTEVEEYFVVYVNVDFTDDLKLRLSIFLSHCFSYRGYCPFTIISEPRKLFLFFAESRAELASSSSRGSATKWHQSDQNHCNYSSCLLSLLCSYDRVCVDFGSSGKKPSSILFGLHRLVQHVHLKCYQPNYLLSENQPIALCFQAISQRSFRIKRL